MKKMMMFLMVSVFFLFGGMTDGKAQKAESVKIQTPVSISGKLGGAVQLIFTVNGIVSNNDYLIYIFVQKPGKSPELLLTFLMSGLICYRNPAMDSRITASYDRFGIRGVVTIHNLRFEDEGIYYVAIGDAYYPIYFSNGTELTVTSYLSILNKTATRKVSASTKK